MQCEIARATRKSLAPIGFGATARYGRAIPSIASLAAELLEHAKYSLRTEEFANWYSSTCYVRSSTVYKLREVRLTAIWLDEKLSTLIFLRYNHRAAHVLRTWLLNLNEPKMNRLLQQETMGRRAGKSKTDSISVWNDAPHQNLSCHAGRRQFSRKRRFHW